MTILLLGSGGLLGSCLARHLGTRGDLIAPPRAGCDANSIPDLTAALTQHQPDYVINCTGFLNVDRCEQDPAQSFAGNFLTAATIARTIAEVRPQTWLIHFSSDFVFDGVRGNYKETDLPSPLSVYGIHKFMADELVARTLPETHYILRTASVFGCSELKGNFLRAMLTKVARGETLRVNETLKVSMATTEFIARAVEEFIAATPPAGLYNLVAEGVTSWFDVLRQSCLHLGVPPRFGRAEIDEYPNAKLRPRNSYLNLVKLRTTLPVLAREWQDVLGEHLDANPLYRNLFR
jgi:dTDP-4-dehydrorhamnose reductase